MGKLPTFLSGQSVRITTDFLNRIIRQANLAGEIDGGEGVLIGLDSTGARVSLSQATQLFQEPAQFVEVVNKDPDDIKLEPFQVAGIEESFDKPTSDVLDDLDLQNRRVLSVRTPTTEDAGRFVIMVEELEPGQVGLACIGGVCLVVIQRFFSDAILNRADISAGEAFVLASVQGPLQILWEQVDADGDLVIDEDHFAIVRFVHDFRQMPFQNDGPVSADFGSALVPSASSGLVDGIVSAKRPDEDDADSVYVVVAGDVPSGEKGSVIFAGAPFLAELDTAGIAGDDYGTETDETEFRRGFLGFKLLANLGTHDGTQWGVLHAKPPFSGYINCEFVNSVDEANPNTVFEADGTVEHDLDASSKKLCYLKLFSSRGPRTGGNGGVQIPPVSHKIGALDIAFSTTPNMSWDVSSGGKVQGNNNIIRIGFILADWNPTTLTFNNRPAPTTTKDYEYIFTKTTLGNLVTSQDMSFRLGFEKNELSILIKAPIVNCTGFSIEFLGSITGGPASNRIVQAVASIAGTEDPNTIALGSSSFGLIGS